MANQQAEIPWVVYVELQGNEIGVLPTFITEAMLYVTATSAKEACYLAERYLKNFQPMNVISVKPWRIPESEETHMEQLYQQVIEAMKRHEQKNTKNHAADPANEAAGRERSEKP